ncbi:MAG: methyltransferase domain-containing protein [Clostridia bacterium]|nr:methyltransferase domain-containing protein [Clostridia bacterium]
MSPFSFFQTNTHGAEKLYSMVRDYVGDAKGKTVFDLYCGTGTIGMIASKEAKEVIGVEIIKEAVEMADENRKLNGIENARFIAGDVKDVIRDLKESPDTIILDPPRDGVHPSCIGDVLAFNAKEIVYVSCNPKSLARDLSVLTGNGYELQKIRCMDMFPHTHHVETVVCLSKKNMKSKDHVEIGVDAEDYHKIK